MIKSEGTSTEEIDANIPEAQVVGVAGGHAGNNGSGNVVVPVGGTAEVMVGGFAALEGRERFVVKQHFQAAEAAAQQLGCGCFEQANKFDVFDADTGEMIIFVEEESGLCCRLCCSPNHEAKLHFKDVRYGVPADSFIMHADKPFKLNCCACFDICRHEVKVQDSNGTFFSHAKVPLFGGGLSPQMEIMTREGEVHTTTRGPTCCLGGLIELCTNIEFNLFMDAEQNNVVGKIVKKKPSDFQGALREAASDADTYMLEMPKGITADQAASIIATTVLLDYLYFEDGAPITFNLLNQSCTVNFCNCYCLGCTCPCSCTYGDD
ncbi:Phospholipid scramblase 3 [Hondaea fermentalgiana]|uniref:Phospholipid scramblase n=1 Tax=Hondaea fermentalgiana TaxID=2315210 RepID=A0A2R5GCY4_9STRA|nr:Phospholipid scramblase 3 [Hondaea fermentalgiana]|eukprot:GBG26453.1 Phospholipid scramblase 3 [Hondaea fermentalgiana]